MLIVVANCVLRVDFEENLDRLDTGKRFSVLPVLSIYWTRLNSSFRFLLLNTVANAFVLSFPSKFAQEQAKGIKA